MALVWVMIFSYEGLYTRRYLFWEEVKALMKAVTTSSFLIMIMIFITQEQLISRTVIVLAWFLSLFLFPLFRYFTKTLMVKFNLWNKKLIILGVMQTSLLALESIKKNKTAGYEIIGFLDDDPKKIGKNYGGAFVLGPISELENIAKIHGSKDIMVSIPHLPREKLKKLLLRCEGICESLWLIPRTGDFVTEGVEINVLGEVIALNIKRNLTKPWNIITKSLFDMITTIFLLLILMPLLCVIALAIKLDSKGPLFYVQKRVGKRKKQFRLYKFRSMYVDGDKYLAEYINKNPEAKQEWEEYKKLKKYDPRVTRVGRIIRKYSLDELPQLYNIIRKEMSLVGPRPYLEEELEGKDVFKNTISRVKPGITGLWQISGRSELPFEKRISIDEYYVRNWSIWLDIIILLKTVRIFFSGKGAY
jgi:undecaprenyl-phosphate galactose phosphotransferase